jgi:hypothetical protein
MVIDGGVDVVVADPGGVMAKASVNAPATTRRDPTQLLDVDVDQVARNRRRERELPCGRGPPAAIRSADEGTLTWMVMPIRLLEKTATRGS